MRSAAIVLVICSKERFKSNDMHVIIVLAQSPKAIVHAVYGADNILVFIKRSVLCGAVFNLFLELLRKFSAGRYIVTGIYHPLFLAGETAIR